MTPAMTAAALLAGAGLGFGLWAMLAALPRIGRRSLTERIAPSLADVLPTARALAERRSADPLPAIGLLLGPATAPLRWLFTMLTGGPELEHRLRRAGIVMAAAEYRSRRLLWCLAGAAAGGAIAIVLAAGAASLASVPLLVGSGAVVAVVLHERMLTAAARRAAAALGEELPTLLEFLALSLSAGEGMLEAITRLSRSSSGRLAHRFRAAVTETGSGVPLIDALDRVAADLASTDVTRLVEQLRAALDRGTPLAEVLHAQASDAREAAKRALLERAGTREIAMLVPVVFLILPVTVLFAVYPGLAVLRIGF